MLLILGREAGRWGDKPGVKISKSVVYTLGACVPRSSSFWTGWYWSFALASGITASLAYRNVSAEPFLSSQNVPIQPPSLLLLPCPFLPSYFPYCLQEKRGDEASS